MAREPGMAPDSVPEEAFERASMDSRFVTSHSLCRSPRSMMLSPEENGVMRMPDFGTFMHHQEHLQQLLVDIHQDPDGFETHVADRRTMLEHTPVPIGGSADTDPLGSLADYTELREVGKGRFSTVFYCRRRRDAEPCAMKRITLSMMQQPPIVPGGSRNSAGGELAYDKCLKEVGLLKNLRSPHVVGLYGCFVEAGSLWIVLEWVDGGDLRTILSQMRNERQRFRELTIWSYTTQMCEALRHMHGQRIMHRDLKPANILIRSDGTLKLGDLGLGRYLHVKSMMAYSQVGTPLYMSPEVLMGRGHTFASDIWSLGCVVYEMAMLQSAFAEAGLTMEKLFRKVVDGVFAAVDTRIYSRALCNLVENLLVVDPEERPDIDRVAVAAGVAHATHAKGLSLDLGVPEGLFDPEPDAEGAMEGQAMAAPAFGGMTPQEQQQQQMEEERQLHVHMRQQELLRQQQLELQRKQLKQQQMLQQQHQQQQQQLQQKFAMAPPPPRMAQHRQQEPQQQRHAGAGSPCQQGGPSATEEAHAAAAAAAAGRPADARAWNAWRADSGAVPPDNSGGERPRPQTLQQLAPGAEYDDAQPMPGGSGGIGFGTVVLRPETPQTERGSMGDPLSPRLLSGIEVSPSPSAGSKRGLSTSTAGSTNGSVDGLSTSLNKLRIRLSGMAGMVGRRRSKQAKILTNSNDSPMAVVAPQERAPHGGS